MSRYLLICVLFTLVFNVNAKEKNEIITEEASPSGDSLGVATWRDIKRQNSSISLLGAEKLVKANRGLFSLDNSGAYAEILAFSNGTILYKQDKNYASIPAINNKAQWEKQLTKEVFLEKGLKRLGITQLENFSYKKITNEENKLQYVLTMAEGRSNKAYCQFFLKAFPRNSKSTFAQRARGVFCFSNKTKALDIVTKLATQLIFDGGEHARSGVMAGLTRKVHAYWSAQDQKAPNIILTRAEFNATGVFVSGRVSDDSGIGFIKIAGERLSDNDFSRVLDVNGSFTINVRSQRPFAEMGITIGDKYGNIAIKRINKKVVSLPSSASPILFKKKAKGRTYALLVSVSNYKLQNLPVLISPPNDVKLINTTLTSLIGIPQNHIKRLHNPTKQEFINTLSNLRKNTLVYGDQLLIYFSGHGTVFPDPKTKKDNGYWLFTDTTSDPKTWMSNQEVGNILAGFSDGGIMLIADSCFSGNFITKPFTDQTKKDYEKSQESRTVLTAGGNNPVPDVEETQQSAFVLAVNASLKHWLKKARADNESTIPGYYVYKNTNDILTKKGQKTPYYGRFSRESSGTKEKDFTLNLGR